MTQDTNNDCVETLLYAVFQSFPLSVRFPDGQIIELKPLLNRPNVKYQNPFVLPDQWEDLKVNGEVVPISGEVEFVQLDPEYIKKIIEFNSKSHAKTV